MRGRGIPASRLCAYSPAFANIVVHEFVEGEMHAGEAIQVPAIAGLCSKLILIGADHGRWVSRPGYLSKIRAVATEMRALDNHCEVVDPAVHSGMLALVDSVLESLESELTEKELFHVHVHDDFTEKNILFDGEQVKLLCDWDSCRLKFINEYLACSVTRFCTERPLEGLLVRDKLGQYLRSLDPGVVELITNGEAFASSFAHLAALKHLRTYPFRHAKVSRDRGDLKTSLLQWPQQHCEWLLANRSQVGEWVYDVLFGS